MDTWNSKKSAQLYHVNSWASGYFDVNEKGTLEVCADVGEGSNRRIDLKELVDDLRERGLSTPLLLRFSNILESRVKAIHSAFSETMQQYEYKGEYLGVYPIKVNQQRFVVEEFVKQGRSTKLGLEAGSKPELLIALAHMNNPDALIICNGFKDMEYVETALLSQKLGRNTILVVDRFKELELITRASESLNIKPRIGFRAKLDSRGSGKWVESSGMKSKFGLSADEIVRGVECLREKGLLDCLELLHFHIGSQVSALRSIKESMAEAAQFYVQLSKMGAPLKYIDVGGGLAVDYDGSQTNWDNSMNYSVKEYASDVVWTIQQACDAYEIGHPHIITESGRALSAYCSVLIFNVVDASIMGSSEMPVVPEAEGHELIDEFKLLIEGLTQKNLNESIQDAYKLRDDASSLFGLGYFSLIQRSLMEVMFRHFCTKALNLSKGMNRKPEGLEGISKFLTDAYFCNFSLFQSAPDTWAVDQAFPIMPIHRLNERPNRQGTLLDLTCDSDGKIDDFIDIKEEKKFLELHELKDGEDYLLGMFLVGAYQEVLGDFHNLFGDTDAVHISLTETGYSIDHIVEGDRIYEVLQYMEYDRSSLMRRVRRATEEGIAKKRITIQEARLLTQHYEEALNRSTYLKDGEDSEGAAARAGFRPFKQDQKKDSPLGTA
ncbi:biosynthetic arginine decarboxylase [bacterium]|nr:biosynthetic arginine decarboxylase [bacterium]